MLIKCPECNKDISDQSDVCIHCGCPISKQHYNAKTIRLSNEICPICKANRHKYGINNEDVCSVCGHVFNINENYINSSQALICSINGESVNLYTVKQYIDQEKYTDAVLEFQKITGSSIEEGKRAVEYVLSNNNTFPKGFNINKNINQNIPKCPICGSTNISKISTMSRATSIIGLGILSKKIGKQWQCNNPKCKHLW